MSAPRINLISKESLIGIVPQFSVNIDDNHFIAANDFSNKRLKKLLPSALWTRLEAVSQFGTWVIGTAYTVGQEVVRSNRGYISIQNGTGKDPLTETAYWTEKEIYSVYRDYIKPFLCWQAYNHFLIYHGTFATQGGIKRHVDLNAEEVSEETRARAIKRAQETADTIYMDFQKYMSDASNTIDSIVYTFSDTATFKPKIGLHMVKVLFLMLSMQSYAQVSYPTPIVNEGRNYHFTKTVYIDGKLKVGYPTPTINRDIHFVADTLRFEGLDGTGTILGIDVNGDVTRVAGVGAGGVTGLNPTQLLFGSSTGTIEQSSELTWNTSTHYQTITLAGAGGLYVTSLGADHSTVSPYTIGIEDGTQAANITAYGLGLSYGANTTYLTRPTGGSDYDIFLPNANGILGQALRLNSSLELEWFTPSAGSVTSFSFTDGSGFDGTVTNATTTPTLALTTTVSDNQIMYSNGGALSGSSLFTYDNTTNNEHFDVTVLEFDVVGTSAYPFSLFNVSDNVNVSICDYNGNANGTYAIFDDPSESITLSANNGITVNQFSGLGQNLIYSNNSGTLGLATLSDFTLSGGALSITSGAIVNADINSSAAIAQTKMAAMTASKAVVTDGSGFETTSSTTSTEIGYVAGVTSAIQTQLDARSKVVATSHLTSQNAAIAATTLYAVPANGFYTITVQLAVTTTGGTSIGTQIRFTNVADNVVKTLPSNNSNGLNQCASTTTANAVCYTITAYCKSGTNIQYITNLAGSGQVYSLDAQVVKD